MNLALARFLDRRFGIDNLSITRVLSPPADGGTREIPGVPVHRLLILRKAPERQPVGAPRA